MQEVVGRSCFRQDTAFGERVENDQRKTRKCSDRSVPEIFSDRKSRSISCVKLLPNEFILLRASFPYVQNDVLTRYHA